MRWLLIKDLQILKRSPLLLIVLLLYPIGIGCLIGLALSGGPSKPKVAIASLVAPGNDQFSVGGKELNLSSYTDQFSRAITAVPVSSRAEAIAKVKSGQTFAALVLPADVLTRLQSTSSFGGGPPPTIEVFYNADDPLKTAFVQATIQARLADANQALSHLLTHTAVSYLNTLVVGGSIPLLGQNLQILGLRHSQAILNAVTRSLPAGAPQRKQLKEVADFAGVASVNFEIGKPILSTLGTPIRVSQTIVKGRRVPLDTFAIAVAVALSSLFVTLLITAGALAVEREENTYRRLVPGLVPASMLLVEKILLGVICSLVVGLGLLVVLTPFVSLAWHRCGLWVAVLAIAGAAFSALGTAIGAIARELRAASLLAFSLALPLALLALVPAGSLSKTLFRAVSAVSAVFPFKAGLHALDGALNGGPLGTDILHLVVLSALFFLIARLSLRRFV